LEKYAIFFKHLRRFILYSGHDNQIKAMLVAIGRFQTPDPIPYASSIRFELYSPQYLDLRTPNRADVLKFRLVYNGKDITSPSEICKLNLEQGELCPISELRRFVETNFGPKGLMTRLCF